MSETRRTSIEEARRVGDEIGVDWSRFDLEQFRAGMDVELEHGSHDPQTDVTHDDPILTGKIALAHMKEFPDYYERLERMEREAESNGRTGRGDGANGPAANLNYPTQNRHRAPRSRRPTGTDTRRRLVASRHSFPVSARVSLSALAPGRLEPVRPALAPVWAVTCALWEETGRPPGPAIPHVEPTVAGSRRAPGRRAGVRGRRRSSGTRCRPQRSCRRRPPRGR